MMDAHDASRRVIIALASSLGLTAAELKLVTPLTTAEWRVVEAAFMARQMSAADLLELSSADRKTVLGLDPALAFRIDELLGRIDTVLRALRDLEARGIWVITEVDATYPQRWIQRLGRSAPPVIFGVGEAAHLSIPAIGIVGSRDISRSLMHVADDLGAAFVLGGYAVVSGGARGTDRMGMMGALEVGGVAIAIVPDHLQRDRLRRANLDDIGAQLLTMVTTVHPDAPFTVANAMSRNRLIYALSDMTVVVSTSGAHGGTWAGAIQNLKHRLAPLAVWNDACAPEANHLLIDRGGYPFSMIPASTVEVRRLVEQATAHFEASAPKRDEPSARQLGLGLLAFE